MFVLLSRRLLQAVPTVLALAAITFFVMRLAPGGPFSRDRQLPKAVRDNLDRAFHLDEPLWKQFGRFLWRALHGDLGPSMTYRDYSVARLIREGAPVSFEIGIKAMLLATAIGLALGVIAALWRNGWIDYLAGLLAVLGIAIPTFVLGPAWQLLFGIRLGILPVAGWGSDWRFAILPVAVLALPNIGYIARLMRASMIEVMRTNYVRTARAKGIGARRTVVRHALRAAVLPVVAYLGPATAITLTGSVVVEQIFQLPGIGRYFVAGAINRDYTLVMGVTLLYGTIVILANAATDIGMRALDPQMRDA